MAKLLGLRQTIPGHANCGFLRSAADSRKDLHAHPAAISSTSMIPRLRWASPFHSFIFTRRSDSPRLLSPTRRPIFRAGWEVLECAVYKYRLGRPSFENCTWLLLVPIHEQPARWTSERAALEAARGRSPSIIVPESLAAREIHRVSCESWQHSFAKSYTYICITFQYVCENI